MPDINAKIKLTGEGEYRQALQNLNAQQKVLNAEVKLSKAEMGENTKSTEALTAKSDILGRSIKAQEEKVRLMREQLEKTASAYGATSTKTLNMEASVKNAEAELAKMRGELKSNQDELDKAAKSTGSLGDKLQGLADKLGIQLPQGAKQGIQALGGVSASAASLATDAALLVAALVKVEKALFDMTKEAASAADELLTLSQQTGVSAEDLQKFQYASEFVDVSVETLQGSLAKLTLNISKAAEGNDKLAATFGGLGIPLQNVDGTMRDSYDVFLDVIDALGRIQNQTERDATAMTIFGKSAQDLNPLINAGSKTLKDLGDEAEKTGYVLDDLALNKLAAMDDAMQTLDKTQEGLQKNLSAQFAPYATEAIEKVNKAFQLLGQAVVDSGAADALGMILKSVLGLLSPLDDMNGDKLPKLTAMLQNVARFCALIADTASVAYNTLALITNLASFHWDRVGKNWDAIETGLGWTGHSNYQQIIGSQKGWKYDSSTGWVTKGQLDVEDAWKLYQDAGGSGTREYWDMIGRPTQPVQVDATYEEASPEYLAYLREQDRKKRNQGLVVGYNAVGTANWRGGWTWVGENGPELVNLPRGSQVLPAQESRQATGGDVFNITIDAKSVREFNDIVQMAQTARMRMRKEVLA